MIPNDIINKLLDFKICYYVQLSSVPEDIFNVEPKPPKEEALVIKDKETLLLSSIWYANRIVPDKLTQEYFGSALVIRVKNGKLIIETQDIPWAKNINKFSLSIEYIEDIQYDNTKGLLFIKSTHGSIILEVK